MKPTPATMMALTWYQLKSALSIFSKASLFLSSGSSTSAKSLMKLWKAALPPLVIGPLIVISCGNGIVWYSKGTVGLEGVSGLFCSAARRCLCENGWEPLNCFEERSRRAEKHNQLRHSTTALQSGIQSRQQRIELIYSCRGLLCTLRGGGSASDETIAPGPRPQGVSRSVQIDWQRAEFLPVLSCATGRKRAPANNVPQRALISPPQAPKSPARFCVICGGSAAGHVSMRRCLRCLR